MSAVQRFRRIEDGSLGWLQDGAIRVDNDLGLKLMGHWRAYTKEDQEDFGLPGTVSFATAAGHWLPEEQA